MSVLFESTDCWKNRFGILNKMSVFCNIELKIFGVLGPLCVLNFQQQVRVLKKSWLFDKSIIGTWLGSKQKRGLKMSQAQKMFVGVLMKWMMIDCKDVSDRIPTSYCKGK